MSSFDFGDYERLVLGGKETSEEGHIEWSGTP